MLVTVVVHLTSADPAQLDAVAQIVTAYATGLALGLLGDGADAAPAVDREPLDSADAHEVLALRFQAQKLPDDAIGVLSGMLIAHQALTRAVRTATLQRGRQEVNLMNGAAQTGRRWSSSRLGAPPYLGPACARVGAPPARLTIEFAAPVQVAVFEEVRSLLLCWVDLARGGFAPEGEPMGSSWVGPTTVTFLHPALVELYTEGLHVGEGAVQALLCGLERVDEQHPIRLVELELQ